MNPDISVVIPVKNGEKYFEPVLKAVFAQEINSNLEVIIVDSGSQDRTLDITKKYPVKLYQIPEKEFNHGLTRNFGISKCCGKYIILMGADVIPYNNYWMQKLIDNLEFDEYVAGVYSRQVPHKDSHLLTRIRVNRFFTTSKIRRESYIRNNIEDYNKLTPKEKHKLCNFENVSSCIKKEIWQRFPFPKTDFGEDIEWAKLVLLAGYKIIYEPESIVYHSHDFSLSGWYKKSHTNYQKLYSLFGYHSR